MARIVRSEYPKIQHMAEVEKRKVAEIAALYGCTPANIYAILAKLRKERGGAAQMVPPEPSAVSEQPAEAVAPPTETSCPTPEAEAPGDLFAALDRDAATTAQPEAAQPEGLSGGAPVQPDTQPAAPQAEASTPTTIPEPRSAPPSSAKSSGRAKSGGMFTADVPCPTKAAKPGYALCMRTSDGDESSTPFRSLEDLLSAARPILRSAARSPDPIWFSIQPVDLADIDSEAA